MTPEREAFRKRHRDMLLISSAVVVLSFALEVQSRDRVALCFLPAYPLPATCLSHSLLGVDCPGCGLTRSFVYLAHGDWRSSWEMHRLGWLLAVAVLLQFPYRLTALVGHRDQPLGCRLPRWFGTLLIVLLLGNWLLQQI